MHSFFILHDLELINILQLTRLLTGSFWLVRAFNIVGYWFYVWHELSIHLMG